MIAPWATRSRPWLREGELLVNVPSLVRAARFASVGLPGGGVGARCCAMTPLTSAQRGPARELLVRAFDEDPFFGFLAPEPRAREAFLRAVMGTNVALAVRAGAAHAALGEDGALEGVCLAFAPGRYAEASIGGQVRVGLPAYAGVLARGLLRPRAIVRALRAATLVEEAHPPEPTFYLQVLGVSPERQGRGVGSAMLRWLCGEADAAGRPAILETSKEANARLYRRSGFETFRTASIDSSPPIWTMRRDPRPLS
ncbi:MAG: GNAT family N-acetyltransferase [Sandaracinaceae bacterium]|nr:GNAT family N-acetyltransferase [Sandaracinaceae bacterium]